MNKKQFITFLTVTVLLFMTGFKSVAQDGNINGDTSIQIKKEKKTNLNRNFLKINITAIAFKNYSLQYERTLNRKFSFALSFRFMPSSDIPFKSTVLKIVNDQGDTKRTIEDFRLSNTAITPEFRFYLSRKGYGRGFYIAPFYRYATFKTTDLDIFYNDNSGTQNTIKLSGKLTGNTGGLLFGMQYPLGRHVVLDIQLLGPHFGSAKGDFSGISAKPLTTDEQDQIRSNLDIDIPLIDRTINVTANNASLKLNGSWGGVRAGISLGVRF